LPDGGASHFASCIKGIKNTHPKVIIEALIPDFSGDLEALKRLVEARPEVIAHNIETTEKLTPRVRDARASYKQSLVVLKNIKMLDPKIYTKSSIMLGLGEEEEDVIGAMGDINNVGVNFLTIGQYLRPSISQLEVKEYVHPSKFDYFRQKALKLGFLYVASGPLVRSSYRASEFFIKA
jgi:lipoic acid synthetase